MNENNKFNGLNKELFRLYCIEHSDSLLESTKFQNKVLTSKDYAKRLASIEGFVNDLLSNKETPFVSTINKAGQNFYRPGTLANRYIRSMPVFIKIVTLLSPKYEYSERLNVFVNACNVLGLLHSNERLDWQPIRFDPKYTSLHYYNASVAEIFNELVKYIRNEWKVKKLQLKFNDRETAAESLYEEYCLYVDALFRKRARLLVLRFDLGYKNPDANNIDIEDMQKDLFHLLRNMRHNRLFAFKMGHILKLEYGFGKGIHCHVVIFLDGTKRNNSSHVYFAEEMGKYWVDFVTKGRGNYWNVNATADHYDKLGRLGIGPINWNEWVKRDNLNEYVIGYLCKMDQYFRPKWGPKVKLIRRGDYPDIFAIPLGRPRKATAKKFWRPR
jgi:hypothetical protein